MTAQFCICYTVKNEASLLPLSIEYHQKVGCGKFYVFLDGTTDETEIAIKKFRNVQIFKTITPEEAIAAGLPAWLERILPYWHNDMDVRKRINTYFACRWAAEEGIDWLIGIDPDEAVIFNSDPKSPSNSTAFFENIGTDVDQLLLRNYELIPYAESSRNPFLEGTLFLNRHILTENIFRFVGALLKRLKVSPRNVSVLEHYYYRIRFLGALPRKMIHPETGAEILAGYFLGYTNHKSIVRTRRAHDFDFVIHKWRKGRLTPKSVYSGAVLHYDIYSFEYFIEKFKQRSSYMIMPEFHVRYELGNIARDCTTNKAKCFYEKYIGIKEEGVRDRLVERGIAIRIDSVSDVIRG